MRRSFSLAALALTWVGLSWAQTPDGKATSQIDLGREAVRGRPPMNPAAWSQGAYENAWKTWGLKEKPINYAAAFRERYGLHEAPYENGVLPMGLHVAGGLFGKGLGADCLLCHAGSVAGTTYIGLGNASLDLQAAFDELAAPVGIAAPPPFHVSNVRGTIEATAVVTYLMEFRKPDLTLRVPSSLKVKDELCEDVPAWWLMKKKKTMYHTGAGHARSVRTMMPFLLSPLNSADHIKKQEPVFASIQAYLLSLEPPKYPFPIDGAVAARGREVFNDSCAKCHGTYGPDGKYPSKVVPLDVVGTDPSLAKGTPHAVAEHYLASWFAQEKGLEPYPAQTSIGYQAPPLDGIWATAPYFHNGSVPTVYHVLNSKARPKIFTRSYRTEREDYATENLGWKFTVLQEPPDPKMPARERRKIYDTTQPGRGNGGHTFGDDLTEPERRAVIEYLKTL
jgi:mono/diheme cytochrome c family protein